MPTPDFDLQSHSIHSDGALPAAEVVQRAAAAGVRVLALTDHDTVDGVGEALDAGAAHGVRVVPATELSAVDGVYEDLHVLGYGIDHTDPALLEALDGFRADRARRADRMIEALEEDAFEIDRHAIASRHAAGKPIGRPHLAAAVLRHPANAARLADEGIDDVGPFIERYLIMGRTTYRARTRPTVEEAIAVIHAAGGVAVWAHPFWDVSDPAEVGAAIERFRGFGMDGVEAFYVTHTPEQTVLAADACDRLGLLTTGSSDFHGPDHKLFHRFLAFELCGRTPRLGPIA
jgi:predicted metal-dependent phosphoesterase TrpH